VTADIIQTKFGTHDAKLEKVVGRRITVLLEDLNFPEGHKMVSGVELKTPEVVSAGAVIRRTTRHEGMTHEIIERGLWDAISGEERAYRGGAEYEMEDMRVHRGALRSVGTQLATWGVLKADEREAINKLVANAAADLRYKVNPYKRRAYDLTNSASGEKDSRGRANPGKRRAELAAAMHNDDLRLEQIVKIYPYLSADLLGMRTYLEEIHDRYDALRKVAEFWKKKFAMRDDVPRAMRLNMWQTAVEAKHWAQDIVALPYRLSAPSLVGLLSIDNLQCESMPKMEVYDHWGQVIRIIVSQSRRRELLEKNIQLGLAEASQVPTEAVFRHLMPLCRATIEAMAHCLGSIRDSERPYAKDIFNSTKLVLKNYRSGDLRNFKKVRRAIKEFSELMI